MVKEFIPPEAKHYINPEICYWIDITWWLFECPVCHKKYPISDLSLFKRNRCDDHNVLLTYKGYMGTTHIRLGNEDEEMPMDELKGS